MNKTDTLQDELRERAWKQGKIVWQASYKGKKAIIKSNMSTAQYPSWVIEDAQHVRWKVLEGGHYL